MSYCPNPNCIQPSNPQSEEFCRSCGMDLIVGDRYRLLRPISAGGFGVTFLGVDEGQREEGDRSLCVLKRFALQTPNTAYAEKAAQLFQEEAARLQTLTDHPQIPQWLDQFDHDGDQYLVQEFIDGQTLEDVLAEHGAFSESQIRTLLNHLLPVLKAIHSYRIIHRDIKPANIILPYGNDRPVLVDFGASKYATNTVLARTGTMIGSAGYAAPEQTLGKATFASDLYSLGVTCIHLLTGVHPFDLYSVSEDRWVWRDFLENPVRDRLSQILDRMLHRALSQRYASASQVLDDLQRVPAPQRDRPSSSSATDVQSSPRPANPIATAPSLLQRTVQRVGLANSPPRRVASPSVLYRLDQTLVGHEATVSAIAISPDARWIASSSRDSRICLWDGDTGALVHTLTERIPTVSLKLVEPIAALGIAPDGRSLLSCSVDGQLKVWNIQQNVLQTSWTVNTWGITAMALSADGELLALGSGDGKIQVWDLVEQRLIAPIHRHRDRITALTFTQDGEWLVSSSLDRSIRVWDVGAVWESGVCELLNTMKPGDRVTTLTFSPDEGVLVSAGHTGELALWNVANGSLLKTIPAHRATITALATSPQGRWLASSSDDSTIKLWEWGDRPSVLKYSDQLTSSWAVKAIAFTADQRALISGGSDGTVQIWLRR